METGTSNMTSKQGKNMVESDVCKRGRRVSNRVNRAHGRAGGKRRRQCSGTVQLMMIIEKARTRTSCCGHPGELESNIHIFPRMNHSSPIMSSSARMGRYNKSPHTKTTNEGTYCIWRGARTSFGRCLHCGPGSPPTLRAAGATNHTGAAGRTQNHKSLTRTQITTVSRAILTAEPTVHTFMSKQAVLDVSSDASSNESGCWPIMMGVAMICEEWSNKILLLNKVGE